MSDVTSWVYTNALLGVVQLHRLGEIPQPSTRVTMSAFMGGITGQTKTLAIMKQWVNLLAEDLELT